MAKLNLSVVMGIIDQVSGPVKQMSGEYGQFTTKIRAVQKAMKSNADAISNIQSLKKVQQQYMANKDAINAAQEKMAQLENRIKSSKVPSAALTAQYNKQQAKLRDLQDNGTGYLQVLKKTGQALKKAGVNTKNLTAEESRLNRENNKSISVLNRLKGRYNLIQKARDKISKPFSFGNLKNQALVFGGIFGGWAFGVNSTAQEMDKLSKTAQNLNMPVEELQVYRSQAEHAGIANETLDKSFIRFTKRLGVLQTTGAGALGSFLKQGKSPLYQQLKMAKTTDEAYQKILETFSKLKTNQQKMAFADAAFGQDGRRMLIMLKEGTKGLSDARKEYNALGGGVTTKDAKSAEAYDDAMQKIAEVWKSIKYAAVAPVLRQVTTLLNQFLTQFKNADWRQNTIERVKIVLMQIFTVLTSVGGAFVFLNNHLPEVILGITMLKIGMIALNAAMASNPIGLVVAAIATLVTGLIYAYHKSEKFRNIINGVWSVLTNIGKGMIGFTGRLVGGFLTIGSVIISSVIKPVKWLFGLLSKIPKSMLPDSIAGGISGTNKFLSDLDKKMAGYKKHGIQLALNGPSSENAKPLAKVQPLNPGSGTTLANNNVSINGQNDTATKSQSTVHLKIDSDKPVKIARVETDRKTDLMVDTGGLLSHGF
ncbi:hypothetical protein [Hydrogenovibrio marinus]|uniref:Phage tail tape measure protein domain-containing protein n=1 Tax=Hydrogenovibrio marinus TaxID=28885 RepID=A0A066ZXM9_HYDMR|nr:hypothetical protein [Hydrogenovibrio marinus]KDN94865.1 hypothetical protein EI16_00685 [Hydrogenovibrio marinus]BBN59326.1 hypothetical protein HVMH_0920 [Hydrogenovibrio marinus]